VRAGETVLLSSGSVLSPSPGSPPAVVGGSIPAEQPHRLESYRFTAQLNADTPGLGSAWEALESTAADNIDWWPRNTAVVLAEIEGGRGITRDSGLVVDQDRTLIRILGREVPP
jgi:hypothetical protein